MKKASGTKVTEGAVVTNSNGIVKITSDNTMLHTYQVATDRFPVKPGERIEVIYDITADVGQIIGVDLVNSARDSWYRKTNRVLLEKGRHKDTFTAVVPEGEYETSLILYNNRVTFDPTQLMIHKLKIEIFPWLL